MFETVNPAIAAAATAAAISGRTTDIRGIVDIGGSSHCESLTRCRRPLRHWLRLRAAPRLMRQVAAVLLVGQLDPLEVLDDHVDLPWLEAVFERRHPRRPLRDPLADRVL